MLDIEYLGHCKSKFINSFYFQQVQLQSSPFKIRTKGRIRRGGGGGHKKGDRKRIILCTGDNKISGFENWGRGGGEGGVVW